MNAPYPEKEPDPRRPQANPDEGLELKPRFALGQVVATPGAIDALNRSGHAPLEFLARHVQGDWGDLEAEDKQENERSVEHGLRILSAYTLSDHTRIWLITEADRSVTTFLLPSEY